MKISHSGNTANNAYYHHLIFQESGVDSELPIDVVGSRHAMSHPAWEILSFVPPNPQWLENPQWKDFPPSPHIEKEYLARPLLLRFERAAGKLSLRIVRWSLFKFSKTPIGRFQSLWNRVWRRFAGRFETRTGGGLIPHRSGLNEPLLEKATIVYGQNFHGHLRKHAKRGQIMVLEHGTLRRVGTKPEIGSEEEAWLSSARVAMSLMVTNLDAPSLAVARAHFPGKWLAYPHPYVFHSGPLPPLQLPGRNQLLQELDSDFLVFLPSSQNWKLSYHDKGSSLAWEAFFALRQQGKRVGLIASEWGLDVREAKTLVAASGFGAHVRWQVPVPRVQMIQLLRQVDVCWDQFSIQGFGANALKVVEAGTPLISQGLTDDAVDLTGFQVPWRIAGSTDTLVDQTDRLQVEISHLGLDRVKETAKHHYHNWFWRYHSPRVTAALARIQIERIELGIPKKINPDSWKRIVR